MNASQTQLSDLTSDQIAQYRANLTKDIERWESLQRLLKNRDFNKVFIKSYCEEEAIRLVMLHGEASYNYGTNKAANREDFQERIMGIARFSEFIRGVEIQAYNSQNQLNELNKLNTVSPEQSNHMFNDTYIDA